MSGTWLIYVTICALYEEAAACSSGHDYTYTASAVFAAARYTVTTRATRLYQTRGKLCKVIPEAAHAFPSTRIAGIRLLKPRVANPRNPAQIPSCLMTIHCASVDVLPTRSTMMKAVKGSSDRHSAWELPCASPLRVRGLTPVWGRMSGVKKEQGKLSHFEIYRPA
jgi:hypothetical protein